MSGPSQLQGIDASGLVAEQVVWVTGAAGAPAQSVMFPGSLALGKWRIRGDEPGTFILERFDDDGSLQTDGWRTVASFGHDPDTNVNRLFVDNLSVGGTDIMQGFENVEPAFSVESPLVKTYNINTGVTTVFPVTDAGRPTTARRTPPRARTWWRPSWAGRGTAACRPGRR